MLCPKQQVFVSRWRTSMLMAHKPVGAIFVMMNRCIVQLVCGFQVCQTSDESHSRVWADSISAMAAFTPMFNHKCFRLSQHPGAKLQVCNMRP